MAEPCWSAGGSSTLADRHPRPGRWGSSKPIYYNFDWQELYYTDPAENKKYAYLTDSENNKILDIFWGNFNAGEQHLNWAKFPAPPPTSGKITVYIPKFMPFEDVPVAQ